MLSMIAQMALRRGKGKMDGGASWRGLARRGRKFADSPQSLTKN
ncbi:hypothetical protein SJA_C1-15370 [Sphingobium indicum UT26S]|uniref:Uncharacterized protein n=1 Tax=Sphingobium indicum (strain DSM 16413 / CCM 7287 / MTCC 6362 / UT26 / NBRC 101211 / UT26S) TaxID=452662 RepID=D4Z189_SPHIU|nr:hypothetical protein SJA_C1-15370 [Sphingobium indicum UT26S]